LNRRLIDGGTKTTFYEKELMKPVVIYYSLTGKTEVVATTAARVLNAEIKKIEEVNPHKPGPLVYLLGGLAAATGQGSRIKPLDFASDKYDFIMVGSPVWAGRPVPAVNAFISETDFKGKDVVVFCTGASDAKGTEVALRSLTQKVEGKAGKVIGSFAIRTVKSTEQELIEKTREEVRKYRGRK
jgi:flavodoxin